MHVKNEMIKSFKRIPFSEIKLEHLFNSSINQNSSNIKELEKEKPVKEYVKSDINVSLFLLTFLKALIKLNLSFFDTLIFLVILLFSC